MSVNWQRLRNLTESKWANCDLYEGVYGFQIQPNTKWNPGLKISDIDSLQEQWGFTFPTSYREFLSESNGFDQDCIDFHAEEKIETYGRICYQYPDDLKRAQSLIKEIEKNSKYVNEALKYEGFVYEDIEGCIPLFGHRALVVFKDKSLSPVISIIGNDVMVYGKSLEAYWRKEFKIEQYF